jgi:glycosidase
MWWSVSTLLVCMLFGLTSDASPDVSKVGKEKVLAWARSRTKAARSSYSFPSPGSWAGKSHYAVVVDRFANGNASNDFANLSPQQKRFGNSSSPLGLPGFRHGGDLRGIINRLGYLQELGVDAIWITPVLLNCGGEYHGYCPSSLVDLDPNFGSWSDYSNLVQQAHSHGIYVVQDIVINHLCSCSASYTVNTDHEKCASVLDGEFWTGGVVGSPQNQGNLSFGSSFFGPMKSEFYFNRCGANSVDDTDGTSPATEYGDFVSTMFDYASYNYDFQNLFVELHKKFISLDVDGFRLDAAKHVTEDFVAQLSTSFRQYASSLGKSNFLVIGEVAAPADWIGRRLQKMEVDPTNPSKVFFFSPPFVFFDGIVAWKRSWGTFDKD